MYCPSVLQLFPQYLTNAEHLTCHITAYITPIKQRFLGMLAEVRCSLSEPVGSSCGSVWSEGYMLPTLYS